MNEWSGWQGARLLDKAADALRANWFAAEVCETTVAAAERVVELGADARTVGFGGSVTAVELGLPARFAALGKDCLIHSLPELTLEERVEIMRRQLTSDLFITGANAVTLDGKIVNIDATGNRVGAMTFGPKKVVIVAGVNKLADDAVAAVARVRRWASPANARRLAMKTPCAESGECADCKSPMRICRVVHVMEKKPRLSDVTVILVAEALGL